MIEKTFFFLAGLPRSGSTVLASILNQNPNIYVTPTSPLLDLLEYNIYEWHKTPTVIANPIPGKDTEISEAIINGCWDHVPQKIIIDKCRGWMQHLDSAEQMFGKNLKLIMPVRDIPSILASYLRVLRESKATSYVDEALMEKECWLNDTNRLSFIWEQHIKRPYIWFKTEYEKPERKQYFHLIEYDDMINNKEQVINSIYDFLEIPRYNHQYDNIVNTTIENDREAWGIDNLHKINPKLEKVAKHPKEVLGEPLYNKYAKMNCEFWRNT